MEIFKKKLDSGVELEIQPADWSSANRLFKVVMQVVGEIRISAGDDVPNTIKDLLAKLISSEQVEEALKSCYGRVLYGGRKVNDDLWEDVKVREDYVAVAKEVLWFNLRPFTKGLGSAFSQIVAEASSFLLLKSKE